jgi:hypothetical protein
MTEAWDHSAGFTEDQLAQLARRGAETGRLIDGGAVYDQALRLMPTREQITDIDLRNPHKPEVVNPAELIGFMTDTPDGEKIHENYGGLLDFADSMRRALRADPVLDTGRRLWKPAQFIDWANNNRLNIDHRRIDTELTSGEPEDMMPYHTLHALYRLFRYQHAQRRLSLNLLAERRLRIGNFVSVWLDTTVEQAGHFESGWLVDNSQLVLTHRQKGRTDEKFASFSELARWQTGTTSN